MPKSVPLSVTVSSTTSARTCASVTGIAKSCWAIAVARLSVAVLDAFGAEHGARAARRMTLHVDRNRIHRDVGRGDLDVHAERRRIPAQSLRPDAEQVHRFRELRFESRAVGIGTMRAKGPGRGDFRQVHAEIG